MKHFVDIADFNTKKLNQIIKTAKQIKKNPIWKSLKSFKDENFFVVDGNQFFNRPGPRLIESVEIFAEIIHPELFDFKHKKKGWISFFSD